jgi:hypothetical protein
MKRTTFVVAAVLVWGCNRLAGGDPPQGSSSAATSSATPTATATATAPPSVATAAPSTATPTATAAPTAAAPTGGPCAQLAQKCKTCPPGLVQSACDLALSAGTLDPNACTNALNDKDIKAQCTGGAGHAAGGGSGAPAGGGACAALAAKCAKCPPGVVKLACSGALTAGQVDPTACTNALGDKDIKAQCN